MSTASGKILPRVVLAETDFHAVELPDGLLDRVLITLAVMKIQRGKIPMLGYLTPRLFAHLRQWQRTVTRVNIAAALFRCEQQEWIEEDPTSGRYDFTARGKQVVKTLLQRQPELVADVELRQRIVEAW